jgi:hypothetical protein
MAATESASLRNFFDKYKSALSDATTLTDVYQAMVDTPFEDKNLVVPLGLGHMVLVVVNEANQTVDRIALSDTESARGAVDFSVKAFRDIKIPLSAKDNILVQAIGTGKWRQTDDWKYTFTPILSPVEARFNQAGAGAACTVVYPLKHGDGAALSFSYFKPMWEIGEEQHVFMRKCRDIAEEALASR